MEEHAASGKSARRPSPAAAVLASALAIGVLAWLDLWTGPHLGLSVFYAAPVALTAWHAGRGAGFAIAALGMVVWSSVEVFDTPQPHPVYYLWNAGARGLTFSAVAYLVARVRGLLLEQIDLASRDSLTGLANARAFTDALQAELERSRRTGRSFALVYADLDNFKHVNDTRGHAAGDQVLRSVAELLGERLRRTDLPARLGGDEFALLLRETDTHGAETLARELHTALQERLEGEAREVGVSMGVVCFLRPPDSPAAAVHAADSLMYAVKADGKRSMRCTEWPKDAAEVGTSAHV